MKSIRSIITLQNACRRLSSAGDFSTAFGLRPHSGRNDIVKPTVHAVISSVSREIPYDKNVNTRTRPHQILARRGSLPSAHSPEWFPCLLRRSLPPKGESLNRHYTFSAGDFSTAFGLRPLSGRNDIVKPRVHVVISSDRREIPYDKNVNTRTRPHQILARRGSLPSAHSPEWFPCLLRRSLPPKGESLNRHYTFSAGDFSTAFGLRPLSGRNDIVKPTNRQETALSHLTKKTFKTNRTRQITILARVLPLIAQKRKESLVRKTLFY